MGKYTLIEANFLKWLASKPDIQFHALFSDWPYNLDSITRRFGKKGAAPPKHQKDGSFVRQSRGFMGQTWDSDFAYQPETWEAISDILLPGAITAGFSHARKWHRLATAQEDAGYIINPSVAIKGQFVELPVMLSWIYGSGKPTGTKVDLQIDRQAGAERKVIGQKEYHGHNAGSGSGSFYANGYKPTTRQIKMVDITIPACDLAQIWQGWEYGSPLSPAQEPIILAQKPYDGSPIKSIVAYGAGAYNIDLGKKFQADERYPDTFIPVHHPGCRYLGSKPLKNGSGSVTGNEPSMRAYGKSLHVYGNYKPMGFEAHGNEDGIEMVPDYDCHPDCSLRWLIEQEKAHYFFQCDWNLETFERLANVDPSFYSAKVSPAERNAGLDDLPDKIRQRANSGGYSSDPKWASTIQKNNHPTLKPIRLAQYIASLLLPPEKYAPRRIVVPCCGVGSEVIGCLAAGWDEVVGIESDASYMEIGRHRVEWWSNMLSCGLDIDSILATVNKNDDVPIEQLSMF